MSADPRTTEANRDRILRRYARDNPERAARWLRGLEYKIHRLSPTERHAKPELLALWNALHVIVLNQTKRAA